MKLSSLLVASALSLASAALDCTLAPAVDLGNGLSIRQIVNPDEGWFRMELMYAGFTWLGVGPSDDGEMIGADAVIGRTDIEQSYNNPGKYRMTSTAENGSGVGLMADAKQTLMDAEIFETDTHTVLRFTKYLEEDGELALSATQSQRWIFAIGSTNNDNTFPREHKIKGKFNMRFTPCATVQEGSSTAVDSNQTTSESPVSAIDEETDQDGDNESEEENPTESGNSGSGSNKDPSSTEQDLQSAAVELEAESDESEYRSMWIAHGFCMAFAWGIFVPLGIGCSVLRRLLDKPTGLWCTLHKIFNSFAVVLTFIGFFIAVAILLQENDDHFDNVHEKTGLAIFILCLVQAILGVFRPHLHTPAAEKKKKPAADIESKNPSDTSHEGSEESVGPTKIRRFWEMKHRFLGMTLLGLAWFNCYSGFGELEEKYGDEYDLSKVFWGVAGALGAIIFLLGYVVRI